VTGFPTTGRVLGIDPGSRRIGIAVSDQDRRVATPLVVVERRRDAQAHRRAIGDLSREWEVVGLVVGLPLSLDGSEGPAAVAARDEAAALADATGLPVTTYDERFTTVTAERAMAEAEVPKHDRRAVVDKLAAAIMLQSWLDRSTAAVDDAEEDR
jgi:putative Holliday junction resolvase